MSVFSMMRQNYRNMLDAPAAPAEEDVFDFAQYLASSSEMPYLPTELTSTENFLHTPLLDDFSTPPDDTPYNDFLTTPMFENEDDFLTGPLIDHEAPLIDLDDYSSMQAYAEKSVAPPHIPLPDNLYTMSPDLAMPIADSFPSTSQIRSTSAVPSSHSAEPIYTGTRRNVTASTLIPLDAPTQQRQYRTPSVTSRREETEGDDDAAKKRRTNTIAARKSRKRKAEHMEKLTEENERQRSSIRRLEAMNDLYRTMLQRSGIQVPVLDNM